jgi:hypothetical protein
MRSFIFIILVGILLASCAPADETLPTLVPTSTATDVPSTVTNTPSPVPTTAVPPTATDTATFTPSPTITPLPTLTLTFTPTNTPTFTVTPTRAPATANPTVFAIASATARVIEQPVISTFTPLPPNATARPTSTGTPQAVADVIILEGQFQEEVDRILRDNPAVSDAEINFTPQGVQVLMTASGGDAITSGSFVVYFQATNEGFDNFLTIYADSPDAFIMNGGGFAPEAFVLTAYESVVPAVFEAFNTILNQRLGEGQHDLEKLVITSEQMEITLYVPRPN